ncbi:hypothetical protein PInf_025058 [Phytophthora infestans]|nr:hypothetical protein PInf_025058 [Phytophthora infestans]
MASVYDEVEIEDMEYDAEEQVYYYPCPCGDRFSIDLEELYDGEDIATCPSCSLTIRVVFEEENLPELAEEDKTGSFETGVSLLSETGSFETGVSLDCRQHTLAQISFVDVFFSSVFAIFLLVASVLAIDAGATAQPPDNNCGTGFSQTGERTNTNDKQGDSLVKGELSHAESTNSDVPHPGQNNPDQNNPDQNNPGQKNTPDQNATSSDGSQEQAPPVLNGDCILTGVYINNTDVYTTITGVTVNSSTGDGIAKNTDGFDLDKNDHVTITRNRIFGQDDCLAMQSSTNTVFSYNFCCGTHGISIGSLGGPEQNVSTTVDGLTVTGNTIVNSTNGIRIKTIIELKGLVTNAVYTDNELSNVTHAIVVHSDYNKTKGGYAGTPTSLVKITNITIDGLKGTSENLYDIVSNPDVVSNWIFKNINVARIKHRKLHR